jgi:hypothetical protein
MHSGEDFTTDGPARPTATESGIARILLRHGYGGQGLTFTT